MNKQWAIEYICEMSFWDKGFAEKDVDELDRAQHVMIYKILEMMRKWDDTKRINKPDHALLFDYLQKAAIEWGYWIRRWNENKGKNVCPDINTTRRICWDSMTQLYGTICLIDILLSDECRLDFKGGLKE